MSSPKRSKPAYNYRELANYVSKYSKYTTNDYVTKFVIEDLGDEPMDNFALILRDIIDKAYENAQKQYNSEPYFYIILIDGESLDYPVRVRADRRDDDNDIFMVNSQF